MTLVIVAVVLLILALVVALWPGRRKGRRARAGLVVSLAGRTATSVESTDSNTATRNEPAVPKFLFGRSSGLRPGRSTK